MNTDGGLSHKLHGLDHLRAFAIIYVFLYHYGRFFPHPEWTNSLTHFGWSGVDLFFLLNAFSGSSLFTSLPLLYISCFLLCVNGNRRPLFGNI